MPERVSGIELRFRVAFPNSGAGAFHLDVDATLPGQGVSAIYGRSGSGKTTLLRCIAGLQKAPDGYLSVNGSLWQDGTVFLPPHRRPLGYVFQEASLFPHLTAGGNLAYALKRSPSPSNQAFYNQIISLLGIECLLQRRPAQLSGGERQRVAIARALLIQPRVLAMDEPLASLDPERKDEILPYLERLRERFDIPVLYVSHSIEEVARLADSLLIMKAGQIADQGPLNDMLSRVDPPIDPGEESGAVLQGRLVERDKRWHLARITFSGGELWIRDRGDLQSRMVRVRVLARDISVALADHDDTSILNRLPAIVVGIAPDPDEAMSLVRLALGETHLLARVTNRSVHHLKLDIGKRVWAQIKSAAVIR